MHSLAALQYHSTSSGNIRLGTLGMRRQHCSVQSPVPSLSDDMLQVVNRFTVRTYGVQRIESMKKPKSISWLQRASV